MKRHHQMMIAGAVGLVVLTIAGAPVWSSAPLVAVIVLCPVLMFFMMRGMASGRDRGGDHDDVSTDRGA